MTYPVHALLRMSGRWFAGEEWSCGLRLMTTDNAATEGQWLEAQESVLEDLVPLCNAWFTRSGSSISNKARLDQIGLNTIDPDGKYANPGQPNDYFHPSATAPTGSSGDNTWPQLTTVISLRTDVERGRATHGRIYPPTAVAPSTTGRIVGGYVAGMLSSMKTFIEAINDVEQIFVAGNIRVGVVSNLGTPGPSRIVTKILCGDVIDTQRRRRNQLPETYVEALIA